MHPRSRNAYFAELADSVMRAAAERGLTVLIEQIGDDREREMEVCGSRGRGWSTACSTAS